MTVEFLKLISFLFLMSVECPEEPLSSGQLFVAQVVAERDMEILDYKQFNCFSNDWILSFQRANVELSFTGKETQKILKFVYGRVGAYDLIHWTILYSSLPILKMLNFDRKNYYMTKLAYKKMKMKHPRWIRTLSIVFQDSENNHVFLSDRKENVK